MMKPTLFFIVFLIMIAGALAASPHLPQAGGLLLIESLKQPYYQSGAGPINLYFHVFNSSTGVRLSIPTVNCTLSLYNSTGARLLNQTATMDSIDYAITLNTNITANPGYYPYIIICTDDTGAQAGFMSDFIELAHLSPAENNVGGGPLSLIILIPLILALILVAASFIFGEDHAILKVFLFLLAYAMVFVSFWFGVNVAAQYYTFPTIVTNIVTVIYILGTIFGVIIIYILIHALITAIKVAAQDKQARLEY
jgi:hypothetical protein